MLSNLYLLKRGAGMGFSEGGWQWFWVKSMDTISGDIIRADLYFTDGHICCRQWGVKASDYRRLAIREVF